MNIDLTRPLTYLITSGTLASDTDKDDKAFINLLELIRVAVDCEISLIQIREKRLSANSLFHVAVQAVRLTRASRTLLLINDRADIACAARADGVHLTTQSIPTRIIRQTFGAKFIIGVSAHNLEEATRARDETADFATFSPVFETASKRHLDLAPVGVEPLREAARTLDSFPLLALGGVNTSERAQTCLANGARGIAAISFFNDASTLGSRARAVREFDERGSLL